jgi:hypothetical protein
MEPSRRSLSLSLSNGKVERKLGFFKKKIKIKINVVVVILFGPMIMLLL